MKKVAIGFALLAALAIGVMIGHSLGEPTSKATVTIKRGGTIYYVVPGSPAAIPLKVDLNSTCWRDARIGMALPGSCQ